jgi:hypothetical protein
MSIKVLGFVSNVDEWMLAADILGIYCTTSFTSLTNTKVQILTCWGSCPTWTS